MATDVNPLDCAAKGAAWLTGILKAAFDFVAGLGSTEFWCGFWWTAGFLWSLWIVACVVVPIFGYIRWVLRTRTGKNSA